MGSQIIATGSYLPDFVVTNHDLAKIMDTTDEWIQKRTGIISRHISSGEGTADFATQVAQQLLDKSGVDVADIGFIVVATMSPDAQSPSTACVVQGRIGATQAFCFDLSAACSGFVFALHVATQMMATNAYQYGMVIGAETMSNVLDWTDRSTAVLFGDGAGGVLLKQAPDNCVQSFHLQSDGTQASELTSSQTLVRNPWFNNTDTPVNGLTMNGRAIFDFVVSKVPQSLQHVLDDTGKTYADLDFIVLHQANSRIIGILSKKFNIPSDKLPMTISHTGNVSAASIPIVLDTLVAQQQLLLNGDQHIIISGFGGGLSWGSLLIKI